MGTRRWSISLLLAGLVVACGDQPTEVVPEREAASGAMQVPGATALATSSTEDGLSITTDKDDYQPGDTVWFSGAGWPAHDTLDILLDDEPATHEAHTWWVAVDESGGFRDSTYVVDVGDLGVTFTLTATSRATGRSLTVQFTDGTAAVDIAPSFYPTSPGLVRFSVLVRNTAGSAVRCVRVTVPSGYTGVSLHTFTVGVTGWTSSVSGNVITLTGASPNPALPSSGTTNWARLEVDATPPSTTTADWIGRVADNTGCSTNPSNVDAAILVGSASQRTYTADFRDGGGVVIASETGEPGVAKTFRLRITNTSGSNGDDLIYTYIALPYCFSAPTGVSTATSNGSDPDFAAEVKDNFIRLTNGVLKKDVNPDHFVQVTFTTTPALGCPAIFRTAAWKSSQHSSGEGDMFVGNHPSITLQVAPTNNPPVANNDSYAVNEDNTLSVSASGVLGNDTDADGDGLTAGLVDGPDNAQSFTLNADGSFSYTPNPNFNGNDSFTYRANDGEANSNVATVTITVGPVNDPPSFTKGPDQTVLEDSGPASVNPWATALSKGPADESGQTLTFAVTNNTNPGLFSAGPAVSSAGVLTFTPAANASGEATITLELKDNGGTANGGDDTSDPQTFTITVTPVNDAPSFTKGADQTVDEGAGAQTMAGWATGISAGPNEGGQTVTFEIMGNTLPGIFAVAPAIAANGTLSFTPSLGPNGTSTITIRLKDDGGTANGGGDTSAEQSFTITVNNVLPSLGPITAPTVPVQMGASVTASATFSDPGTADPHTTHIDWGDGMVTSHAVSGGSTTASGSHAYTDPGVYTLKMKVQDDEGYSNEVLFQYVVVYDPSAGFVTGGGWINSPSGAYTPDDPSDPDLIGKANFGFVSKYQKGATVPTGNTEFQFHAGDLNFKSMQYEWLVVQGNSRKASYKGTGTVNGTGQYGFLLTVYDGGNSGDKFRIKIWNKATGATLYDNQSGAGDDADASQLIAGGSIVIHAK